MRTKKLATPLKRREFLTLCAAGTLPGVLAACQSQPVVTVQATPRPTSRPTPSPTSKPTLTNSAWTALAASLQGTLIRPENTQYATARQLFDPRFDSVTPAAIAYCASPADVQKSLAFVREFSLPFSARCGGHSYAGYSTSTGLVLDVTRMNTITLNANATTATIGAGTRLIDVYSGLAENGVVLPAGSCSTVGIAGQTLGGGVGVIGRKFGLTADNLLAAQVVVADGRILTCDASQNSDLFWALRGGGGGNFGVVTSFTFQVHPVDGLALFTLRWPWSSAANVINAWQHWAPQAPDELWSNCLLLAPADKNASPIIQVNGVYVGAVDALTTLLQQLTSQIDATQTLNYVSSATVLDTMLYEAGCSGKSVAQCHLPSQNPSGQARRDTSNVKSDYFTSIVPMAGINTLVHAIETRFASSVLGDGGIGMDSLGGAINRVAPGATAFVHRNALFSAQYSASWNASDASSVVTANHAWLTTTRQAMQAYSSGASYQNYVDPGLADWQHAYYGSNLARLQQVKSTYDPGNFFHFAQSIPLA